MISVLVAAAVAGIVMLAISQLLTVSVKSQKRTEQNFDLIALRGMLLTATSCADSLTGGTCTAGNAVPVLQRIDATTTRVLALDTGAGTKYGPLTLKAECAASGRGIVFKVARLTSTGSLTSTVDADFDLDPFKNTRVKWSSPESLLFDSGIEVCGNSSTAPSGVRVATLNMQCNPIDMTTTGPTFAAARNRLEVNLATTTPSLMANSSANCLLTAPGMGSFQSAGFDLNRPAYFSFSYTGGSVKQTYANTAMLPQINVAYIPGNASARIWLRDADDPDYATPSRIAFSVTFVQP